MPALNRPLPPYAQIANHYREAIASGELQPGARLPSLTELAETWGVAPNTAAKAIGHLQVEGAIYTSPRGSFVADGDVITRTPNERARGRTRRILGAAAEGVTVTAADIVAAPNYVAELLGIDIGALLIRREEITHKQGRPIMLAVDWIPALDAMESADLTGRKPVEGGLLQRVERVTRRTVTHGRDHIRGRASDGREADALHLPVGGPILAGVHVWSDDDGVILYGEWVLPPDQVISYEYQPEAAEAVAD
jgi:GntR family transcriptional regulator